MNRKVKLGLIGMLTALLVAGCAQTRTTSGGVVGVEREQMMLVSAGEVNQAAAKAYSQTIREAQAKHLLNNNATEVQRVRQVAARLTRASGAFRPDAPGWPWESNVLSSQEINAWCMPGGKIAVYTGLIEKLNLNDNELAAVMGHEIAHALREHGREKAGQAAGMNVATSIGGALLGAYFGVDTSLGQTALDAVGELAFMRPNSRGMEQEADRIGIELAARAGYDPYAAITLWQKMERTSGSHMPQWLSTHPSHESRIADLRVYADRVRPLYDAARRNH